MFKRSAALALVLIAAVTPAVADPVSDFYRGKNIQLIEHLIRRGRRQLDLLRTEEVTGMRLQPVDVHQQQQQQQGSSSSRHASSSGGVAT